MLLYNTWKYAVLLFFINACFCQFGYSMEPTDCVMNSDNINSLMKCLQNFIIRKHNSASTWSQVPPTSVQREAWSSVIRQLLNSERNCTQIKIPQSLTGIYDIKQFMSYCVLYETKQEDGHFARGWGIVVVPYSSALTRLGMVHMSAAHSFTDSLVQLQAANLFHLTRAKSLLISGVARDASNEKSKCENDYYRFDGAHDNDTMFHTANLAIMKWQLSQQQGCPWQKCSFIQFHGEASSLCSATSIFLSAGLGTSSESLEFYKNNNLPVQRLKNRLREVFAGSLSINTPLDDKLCKLTAGSNVFGRVLNGVPIGQECQLSANAASATGYFIHAEQSMEARTASAYNNWADAITNVFK